MPCWKRRTKSQDFTIRRVPDAVCVSFFGICYRCCRGVTRHQYSRRCKFLHTTRCNDYLSSWPIVYPARITYGDDCPTYRTPHPSIITHHPRIRNRTYYDYILPGSISTVELPCHHFAATPTNCSSNISIVPSPPLQQEHRLVSVAVESQPGFCFLVKSIS